MGSKFRNIGAEISSRLPATMVIILAYWVPAFALFWFFDLFDDIYAKLLLTALVSGLPLVTFFSKPQPGLKRWGWKKEYNGLVLVMWLVALFASTVKFGFVAFGGLLALIILILPLCWFIWLIISRSWLLTSGLLSAFALFTVYWVAALVKLGEPLDLIFVPLLLTSFGGAAWAPLAAGVLYVGQQHKHRRISGPAWQVAVMITLFMPVSIVVIVVPRSLQLDPIWSVVSLTMLGVLLSSVISEPLRRVLVEWGDLKSFRDN